MQCLIWQRYLALSSAGGIDFSESSYYFGRAEEAAKEGNYLAAKDRYIRAIAMEPTNAAYHSGLAVNYASMREPREAEEQFNQAVELDPANAGIHYKLADYYISAGRINNAYDEYSKAVLLSGGESRLKIIEEIYERIGRDPQALSAIVPHTDETRYALAEFLRSKGLLDQSLKEFEEAAILAGQDRNKRLLAGSLNFIGVIYLSQEKPDIALGYFKRASEIEPDNAWFLHNLGQSYFDTSRLKEARDALEKSIKIDPAKSDTHLFLGYVYEGMGLEGAARDSYLSALKYNYGSGSGTAYIEARAREGLGRVGYGYHAD